MRKKGIFFVCALLPLLLLTPAITQGLILDSRITDSLSAQNYNEYENSNGMPLETVISRRMSIRDFKDTPVPVELLLKVLWAAYGYSWRGRVIPSLSDHPLRIYVCNASAVYKFVPETNSLVFWKDGDYRELSGGYTAPIQLFITYDTNICPDVYLANVEAGCPTQTIYLMAAALNLGTVCIGGGLDTDLIIQELSLLDERPLYKMPLGYPLYSYYQNLVPTSRQSSPELPEIQDSNLSFEDALNSVFSSHEWSENPITKQELSQILWASYGYSYYEDTTETPSETHRTVPSAGALYPMRIYAANSSGVYQYLPEQHTLTRIVAGDRRLSIAQASENSWASSAPLIIALAWDDSKIFTEVCTVVESGLITQNVYMESAAWGLIADWGKADTDEEAVKLALGLTGETNLHPVSIITIGHPSTYLHKAEWDETIYPIKTTTNSTISSFAFDQPNKRISFDVSGHLETHGFCNVTVPSNLLWGSFSVLINGNPITTLTQNSNSTHASLHFTYELSSNLTVDIVGDYVIPEFHTWPSILILMILMFTIIIYKRKNL